VSAAPKKSCESAQGLAAINRALLAMREDAPAAATRAELAAATHSAVT
jgi:hypothetical protein